MTTYELHRERAMDPRFAPPALPEPSERVRYDLDGAGEPEPRGSRAPSPRLLAAALVAVLLGAVALVLARGLGRYPSFSDDEGTYVAQAWAFLANGSLSHYTYWYDHPPLGWIQLSFLRVLADPLLGEEMAVREGRAAMLVPALVSAALVYVLARRLGMQRVFAVCALLLFALSPLSVAFLRMVYLDNLATPWILAAFVLAASPDKRLWAYAGSGVCMGVAVLTKETSLVVLPALLLAVWQALDRRTRSFCITAFLCVGALVLVAYPLYATLKGELLPGPGHVSLFEAIGFQLYGRPSTGSVLAGGSASRELVESWLSLDAVLLAAGVALLPVALLTRSLRPVGAALLLLVLTALRPGYLPQPYVIALLPFCALVIAGSLDVAARRSARWAEVGARGRAAAAGALAVGAALALAPTWYRGDTRAMERDETSAVAEANRWIPRHVDRRARLLVDDNSYVDLVEAGFGQRFRVVWFYKLDFTTNLDPSVRRALRRGWRSFDYVVSTPVIRSALRESPQGLREVRAAVENSRPVKAFGHGAGRVEVRRVVGEGTGSGFLRERKAPTGPLLQSLPKLGGAGG